MTLTGVLIEIQDINMYIILMSFFPLIFSAGILSDSYNA